MSDLLLTTKEAYAAMFLFLHELWEKAVPFDLAAIYDRLDALARKLRELSDWEKLVELILGRVGVEPTSERRAEMLLDVARVFEQEVGDLSKAFTALVAAYKEHPRVDAWNELERLASATGMWSELLSELTEGMPTLPDGERAAAWLRIARLYGDKLNAAESALTSLDEALEIDATLADAAELRIAMLRRVERWTELAAALAEAGRWVEQAEVFETRLSDGTAAAAAYRRALEKDPLQHEARAALEQLLRRTADWRALATVLDERAKYATGDEVRALHSEAASLFADRLDDKKQAIARYEALAADDKRDLATLRALERLYKTDGQEKEYIECLGRQAEAVDSDRERAALYRRMASLWEELPGSTARAEECLETTPSASGTSSSTPAVATRSSCRRPTRARFTSRSAPSTSMSSRTRPKRSRPISTSRRCWPTMATPWRR